MTTLAYGAAQVGAGERLSQKVRRLIDELERDPHLSPVQPGSAGDGFRYKGEAFTNYTDLPLAESAFFNLLLRQKVALGMFLWFLAYVFILNWHAAAIGLFGALTALYFLDLLFGAFIVFKSYAALPEIRISAKELSRLRDEDCPTYTIFCPLYKEWRVAPQFVAAMQKLDYPHEKLQVLFLLEENDAETIENIRASSLPPHFHIAVVPHGKPKTKPKAMNYGLKYASGDYVVVYDAEDIPEVDQLKKAVLAFRKSSANVACIQAKLNFYNPHQNLLTKLFTAEYSFWFDLILPGFQSISAPIPLGGTSNHFRLSTLRELGGWDAFNVTEDCDLGMRLAKRGYRTAIVDSTTYEEANSDLRNWYNQRSRWIKGYLQTYAVHMRNPGRYFARGNWRDFFLFQLIVGGKILSLFINPLMWVTTVCYFLFRAQTAVFIESLFPGPILYLGAFSLIFGNFLYVYYYMVGCVKRGYDGLVKYVFLIPLYWLGMSFAAWKALYEMVVKPHYWAKTVHGFHLAPLPQAAALAPQTARIKLLAVCGVSLALWWNIADAHASIQDFVTTITAIHIIGFFLIYFAHLLYERLTYLGRNIYDALLIFQRLPRARAARDGNMRILIFNWRDSESAFAGGAETYIHALAERWVAAGHAVTLFTSNDGTQRPSGVTNGIRVIRRGGFYGVYALAPLYYLFKLRGRFDVIIDCENGIPFFMPLFAKEPVYCLLHHIHQNVFRKSLAWPLALLARSLEKDLMPLVYRHCAFITVSHSSKRDMQALRITDKDIQVVYPGVDLDFLTPGEKSPEPQVAYVGRLKEYKSVDVLIRAFARVLTEVPGAKLVIAGDGDDMERLRKVVADTGLAERVSFLGKVSEDEKLQVLRESWVCVNPSLMEGWGITVIEANACGTPVVASDVPGLRDSVCDGTTGLLSPYGDSAALAGRISLLLTDGAMRRQLSRQAVAWAQNFQWHKSSARFIRIVSLASYERPLPGVLVVQRV